VLILSEFWGFPIRENSMVPMGDMNPAVGNQPFESEDSNKEY